MSPSQHIDDPDIKRLQAMNKLDGAPLTRTSTDEGSRKDACRNKLVIFKNNNRQSSYVTKTDG